MEDLGYSTLYMPIISSTAKLAPMPAIAVAPRTRPPCGVGALVFDNDYKHPAILAQGDGDDRPLTDGRCELGIGAGWMKTDYDALGLSLRLARRAHRAARRGGCR